MVITSELYHSPAFNEWASSLMTAIQGGNLSQLRRLLQEKRDWSEDPDVLHGLLEIATVCGRLRCVRFLVECGASVVTERTQPLSSEQTEEEITLDNMMDNIRNQLIMMESWLAQGIVDDAGDSFSLRRRELQDLLAQKTVEFKDLQAKRTTSVPQTVRAVINMAAAHGRLEIVRYLLSMGVNPDLEVTDDQKKRGDVVIPGSTPLMNATRIGHREIVRLLLAQSVRIDIRDERQRTPLHWAVIDGHTEVIELLLNAGAAVDARDNVGNTPLDLASTFPIRQTLKRARRFKDSLSMQMERIDFEDSRLPSRKARPKREFELVDSSTQEEQIDFEDYQLADAIALSLKGKEEEKGGTSDTTDVIDSNLNLVVPIIAACRESDVIALRSYRHLIYNVEPYVPALKDALLESVLYGRLGVLQVLIQNYDILSFDSDGEFEAKLIHLAVSADQDKVLRFLLNLGCNRHRTYDGYTPLQMATYMGRTEIAKMLRDEKTHPAFDNVEI